MATPFSYDLGTAAIAPGNAPQASSVQSGAPQVGLQGGFVANVAPVAKPEPTNADRTLDAILEIGKGALNEKLKQQQNKAFLGGVQRVMQGEAVKDIVNEQPWYTEIFGPSSTVEGARAYSQVAQVDKFTGDLYGDMDRLQTIDPSLVGDEVNTKMGEFLTGDDITDTAIQMKMVESVGPFFKAQAKNHYKWQQTNMQTQVTNAMLQASSTIQAAAKGWVEGTSTEQDRQQALSGAIGSWQPLPGQSSGSYWEAVKTATITAMAQGNHYMAQAVWANPAAAKKSGPDYGPTDASGMVAQGNINLNSRPTVHNADGTISTVRSMSFEEDGKEILIPTVSEDGRIMSDKEAMAQYKRTGKHLGKFDNPDDATAYAERLHENQAQQYEGGGSLFDAAPADIKLDLLNARETYENRTKQKEGSLEFGAEMGRIQGLMATHQVTPQAGIQMMEAVNTKFRLKTGIDGDMYDKKDIASFVQQDYVAYYAAAEKARTANATGDKEAAKLIEQANSSQTAFMLGNAQGALDSGVPRQVVDNVALATMERQAAAGQDPNVTLVKNFVGAGNGGSGYVNHAVQNNMLSGIYASAAGYTPLLEQSVAYYDKLVAVPGGEAAAVAYFGTENKVKINNYKQYLGSGMAPELAWQASFGKPVNKIQTTSKEKLTKQLVETVKSDQPGILSTVFGGETGLTKNNMGVLATATQRHYDVLRSQIGVGEEQAMAQALKIAKQEVDIVGPYAYQKSSMEQKPVAALIGADPQAAGRVVADFFAQKANKQGFKLPAGNATGEQKTKPWEQAGRNPYDPKQYNATGQSDFWEQWGKDSTDSVTMIRGLDRVDNDGRVNTTFVLMGVTDDGKPVQMGATSQELREFYEQQPYFKK